jgi:hypothetical protein
MARRQSEKRTADNNKAEAASRVASGVGTTQSGIAKAADSLPGVKGPGLTTIKGFGLAGMAIASTIEVAQQVNNGKPLDDAIVNTAASNGTNAGISAGIGAGALATGAVSGPIGVSAVVVGSSIALDNTKVGGQTVPARAGDAAESAYKAIKDWVKGE